MKCRTLLSLLVCWLLVSQVAFGQDDAEKNIHYEKLKVLEPIIGTWSYTFTSRRTDKPTENRTTYRWTATKRMIIADTITRELTDGQLGEWTEGGPRHCYVWNQKSECIEVYSFYTLAGQAVVNRVVSRGHGEFELVQSHITTDWGTASMTITISDEEITTKLRNRKGVDGEPLDDQEWTVKRVK